MFAADSVDGEFQISSFTRVIKPGRAIQLGPTTPKDQEIGCPSGGSGALQDPASVVGSDSALETVEDEEPWGASRSGDAKDLEKISVKSIPALKMPR